MKPFSRNQMAIALGVATWFLVAMPSSAGAQSTGDAQPTQSMPGMQMPMKPAGKENTAKEEGSSHTRRTKARLPWTLGHGSTGQ